MGEDRKGGRFCRGPDPDLRSCGCIVVPEDGVHDFHGGASGAFDRASTYYSGVSVDGIVRQG